MLTAMHNIRAALRSIAQAPALSAVIVGSLAIGIGVNTVVFSWIQARLLQPFPGVSRSPSFLVIEPRTDAGGYPGASWLDYRDLRERLRTLPDALAFRIVPLYVGETGRVERVFGMLVSDNYFSGLGLQPAAGRFFRPDEVIRPGGEPVAVISYGLWQTRFAGAPEVIGRPLRVNRTDLTIIGVTPQPFQGTVPGLDFSAWVPATMAPVITAGSRELEERGFRGYSIMARLSPSASRADGQRELTDAMARLAREHPPTNATMTADVRSIGEAPRGPQRLLTTALAILQGVMLLLLLAVCGNTANLVLARASARQKEIGIRLALGAGPRRIIGLLLAESLVLAIAGAVLGAAIAVWGTRALVILPLTGFPIRFQTSVDGLGLAFAMLLGVLSGVAFGAAPALQLAYLDPQRVLRAGLQGAGRSRLRNALMGTQVALALVVLIVAGLFVRGFLETRTTETGFRREGVLLAAYDLNGRNATQEFTRTFANALLTRLRAVPSIEGAAIATSVPLDIHGLPSRAFTLEGRARSDADPDEALTNTVTPGYFDVMGIPLLSGRDFADLSVPVVAGAPGQAIVNDAFVRRYLGQGEPIGRRLGVRGRQYVITGVVKASLYDAFGEPPTPIIYVSYRDAPASLGEIHVRTRGSTETAIAPEIRRIVREIDPELPVFNVRTLTDHVETNLVFRRVPARMFSVLGPLLVILAAIGIYAVVAYSVSLRRREIGVRLALGATAARLIAQFIGEHLAVIGLGGLLGWVFAFVVVLDVADQPLDLPVFIGVPALLFLVATFACWLPSRRAARHDPMNALRTE
jgi:putative ABC transport system permease protein